MNAVLAKPQAKASTQRATVKLEPAGAPSIEPEFDADTVSLILMHALSISHVLSNLFGRGTSVRAQELRSLDGLMGTVQHLRRILSEAHSIVTATNNRLPLDFRERVGEAANMAALIDEIESFAGYRFLMDDNVLAEFFSAINCVVAAAKETIDDPDFHAGDLLQ